MLDWHTITAERVILCASKGTVCSKELKTGFGRLSERCGDATCTFTAPMLAQAVGRRRVPFRRKISEKHWLLARNLF